MHIQFFCMCRSFFYYLIWERRLSEGDQADIFAIDFWLWIIIFKNIFENCIKVCNFFEFCRYKWGALIKPLEKRRWRDIRKLTGREKKFCSLFLGSGNSELAAEKAGYTGDCEQKGEELICRPEISAELERLSRLREKSLANMAAAGYQRLAFGSICDAISLLYKSDPDRKSVV